jgi:hypothetical protein
VRLGRVIAPTEHRLEAPGECQITECHGIRWVQGNSIVESSPPGLGTLAKASH